MTEYFWTWDLTKMSEIGSSLIQLFNGGPCRGFTVEERRKSAGSGTLSWHMDRYYRAILGR